MLFLKIGLLFGGVIVSAASSTQFVGHENSIEECKGYTAENVKRQPDGLTAELQLIGSGCNVYGKDYERLKLEVKYPESMATS